MLSPKTQHYWQRHAIRLALIVWLLCARELNKGGIFRGEKRPRDTAEDLATTRRDAPDSAHDQEHGYAENQLEANRQENSMASFTLLSHSPGEWRFAFKLPDFEIFELKRPDGNYSYVRFTNGAAPWYLQQRGKPELPVYRCDFALPENAEYELRIVALDQERINCLPPLPSAGNLLRQSGPWGMATANPDVYEGSQRFPASLSSLGRPYHLRRVKGVGVQVTPLQYLPEQGQLLVTRSFEAQLRLRSDNIDEHNLPVLDDNAGFAALQSRLFLNAGQLSHGNTQYEVGHLLLILPTDWQETAADFMLWKQRLGYQVSIAAYPDETGSGSEGIYGYIAQLYQEQNLSHVILCGDWDWVPPWRLSSKWNGMSPNPSISRAVSTDAPYALMSDATPDSPDYAADLMLSRVSVNSKAELLAQLTKLQSYEQGQSGNETWRQSGLFMASNDNGGSNNTFDWDNAFIAEDNSKVREDHIYMERLRGRLLEDELLSNSIYLYDGKTPMPCASAVSNSLNAGTALFYYLGHGYVERFKTSDFNISHAGALTNQGALPYVIAPVCDSGNFAYKPSDCLSEALMKNVAGGAAAVLASTGETYWRAPIVTLWKFTDSLLHWHESLPEIGALTLDAVLEGVRYCQTTTDSESDAAQYFYELMHLFGDSSQTPRLGTPCPVQAQYVWQSQGLLVRVQDETGQALAGAKVCLSFGEPEQHVSAASNMQGEVVLPVDTEQSSYTLRILHHYAPLLQLDLAGRPILDQDEDGQISNNELLTWLSQWDSYTEQEKEERQGWLESALQQWQENAGTTSRGGVDERHSAEIPVFPRPELQIQVRCDGLHELQRLADTGLDIINVDGTLAYVDCLREQVADLRQAGFDIVAEQPYGIAVRGNGEYWEGYASYAEINTEMLNLAAAHPEFCQPSFVGKSVYGRDILALRLSLAEKGSPVPELLLLGGMHGDEPPSMEICLRLLRECCEQLADGEGAGTVLHEILQNAVLWVLPVLNPDGLALRQRHNANYADLNRHFPDGALLGVAELGTFSAGSSLRLAGRQPEQVQIMRWLASKKISASLYLHTGALGVYYPYGNYIGKDSSAAVTDHEDIFVLLAQTYAQNHLDTIGDVRNAASWFKVEGELPDWQYRFLGALALTVELTGPQKVPPYESMTPLWNANKPAILAWMQKVIGLYTDGRLPENAPVSNSEYSLSLTFDVDPYLPGSKNIADYIFHSESGELPVAFILTTQLPGLPGDWSMQSGTAGLNPLASCQLSPTKISWLYYPLPEAIDDCHSSFTLFSPEDSSREARFPYELYWDGGNSNGARQLLPLPERNFMLIWQHGWNAFSLPIYLKSSADMPFSTLQTWQDSDFVACNQSGLLPGKAYFGYAANSGQQQLSGWMPEEIIAPANGAWQMRGTIWPQKLPEQNGSFLLEGKIIHKAAGMALPGKAYWQYK